MSYVTHLRMKAMEMVPLLRHQNQPRSGPQKRRPRSMPQKCRPRSRPQMHRPRSRPQMHRPRSRPQMRRPQSNSTQGGTPPPKRPPAKSLSVAHRIPLRGASGSSSRRGKKSCRGCNCRLTDACFALFVFPRVARMHLQNARIKMATILSVRPTC